MEVVRGKNPQKNVNFYNKLTDNIQKDIWTELENGLWQNYIIENRLTNEELGELKQEEWKDVFPNIMPIYPGFKIESGLLKEDRYIPKFVENASLETFLKVAEQYFHSFDGKRIGVHLSGGLDSSLIICLLKYFHIPFVLVGLTSNRFELRTERHIQLLLMNYGIYSELISFEEFPYFQNLECIPKHQYPDSCLKSNSSSLRMIESFKYANCDVVFTGQGGDTILVKSFADLKKFGVNINNEMTLPWEDDLLYSPAGLALESFFAYKPIIDQLYSLRYGQNVDYLKRWARNFFKSFLPSELVKYCYCADFYALCLDGLDLERKTISFLFEEAYDILHHHIFSPSETKFLLKTDLYAFSHEMFWKTCSKISIAVWLHSLFRKDV